MEDVSIRTPQVQNIFENHIKEFIIYSFIYGTYLVTFNYVALMSIKSDLVKFYRWTCLVLARVSSILLYLYVCLTLVG